MRNKYWSIGHRLPTLLANPLFGDREQFGLEIQEDDPDWLAWQAFYLNFYQNTQKQGLGKVVNDAGYRILQQVDLTGKTVLRWDRETCHITVSGAANLHTTLS
jgi:hypothetical protein